MNPEACVPVIVLGKGMSDRFNVEWVPSSLLLLSEAWDIIKNLKLCMPVYRQLLKKLHRLCCATATAYTSCSRYYIVVRCQKGIWAARGC